MGNSQTVESFIRSNADDVLRLLYSRCGNMPLAEELFVEVFSQVVGSGLLSAGKLRSVIDSLTLYEVAPAVDKRVVNH